MNYSLPHDCDNSDKVYEVRKPWNQLASIYREIEKYPDRRINIVCDEKTDIEKLFEQVDILKLRTENYTISTKSMALLRVILEKDYYAYCECPVMDAEGFYEFTQLGVSDIVIDGPLGFDMPTIKRIKKDIIVRANPIYSYNILNPLAENLNSFFIRPEDVELYEDVIDILNLQKDSEYNVYNEKLFLGTLSQLLPLVHSDVSNFIITKDFAQTRYKCRQICKQGHPCHFCQYILNKLSFAATLGSIPDPRAEFEKS